MGTIIRYSLFILLLAPVTASAEIAYVIDQVKVGLHQDNSLDSPVIKLLATGAELEVLGRNEPLSQIKDTDGVTGWIKNEYLQAEKPTRRLFEEVSSRNQQLKNEIAKLKTQLQQNGNDQQLKTLTEENKALKQDLKSARLKAGELEAELSKLRKTAAAADNGDNRELYTRIATLEQEKVRLEEELQGLQNPPEDSSLSQDLISLKNRGGYLKRHAYYLLAALIAGLVAGLLLYDVINRRRHSGFRV